MTRCWASSADVPTWLVGCLICTTGLGPAALQHAPAAEAQGGLHDALLHFLHEGARLAAGGVQQHLPHVRRRHPEGGAVHVRHPALRQVQHACASVTLLKVMLTQA